MNRYTQKQLTEIVKIITTHTKIPYSIMKLFMDGNHDLVENNVRVCFDNEVIYQRFKSFNYTKRQNNRPDKNLKAKVNKVKVVLFDADKRDLPLYINEEVVLPLVKWRLENNV